MPAIPQSDYEKYRQDYSYVPAKIVNSGTGLPDLHDWEGRGLWIGAPTALQWSSPVYKSGQSSIGLDNHHERLLNSKNGSDNLHGLLSVVFWGNFSDRHGKFLSYALPRAEHLLSGRSHHTPQPSADVLVALQSARGLLKNEECSPGHALREAMNIKYLGLSFSSKVLSFIAPECAVVYDAVISKYLQSEFSPNKEMGISVAGPLTKKKIAAYSNWCSFCKSEASSLNKLRSKWTDWDGIKHNWRAVDVERAHFAKAAAYI
jgi:hypothetical protein